MPATEKKHIECPYCGGTRFTEKTLLVLRKESPTMFWNYEQPKRVQALALQVEYYYYCANPDCGKELDRYAVSQGLPIAKKNGEVTNEPQE